MACTKVLVEGREAFARQQWRDAYLRLSAADDTARLEPDDLERLAAAAYLIGRESEAVSLWTRAHHVFAEGGDFPRAARWGFWLSLNFLLSGDAARSTGWLARTERLISDQPGSCAELGYGLIVRGLMALANGDRAGAGKHFQDACELAQRFGDPDLMAIALLGQGQHLILSRNTPEGVARLDEAMLRVTAGEVSPIFAGIVYCAVILACQEIFDVRRAQEWTLAMNEWCAAQPDLVPFRGQCIVHRSELLQQRGDWTEALTEAERACEQLAERSGAVVGRAWYQRGELHRLRGEFARARRSYREAARHGCEPEPGLCLLQLAAGDRKEAAAAVRGLMASADDHGAGAGPAATKLLPSFVEILIAAGDLDGARAATAGLEKVQATLEMPFLRACAAESSGYLALAGEEYAEAQPRLRKAWQLWRELEMPFQAARAQALLGRACCGLGDRETACLHLEAAQAVFSRLGARVELANVDKALRKMRAAQAGALTDRELEVLSLVAEGRTNRSIAAALAISEHTVARHLANIFDKLGVSSRTAASMIARQRELL